MVSKTICWGFESLSARQKDNMIRVYPNVVEHELIDDALLTADYSSAVPWAGNIPNLNSIHPIKHRINRTMKQFGELKNVELLVYTAGSYSTPHIDDYEFNGDYKWVMTGILFTSEPEEYSGGELVFNTFNMELKPPKGTLVLFPAGPESTPYVHSVKPVTGGKRTVMVYRFI
jgi:2OG-Fe(II) oxygenase superfamily